MNYLAHTYLARHSDDAMLGALLGDFVFGKPDPEVYEPVVLQEIMLHRKIDRYTDSHPAVEATRSLFPDGRRRYAGIALDIYYDHLLARDWARYSEVALDDFSRRFYGVLLARRAGLPERLQAIAPHMAAFDWFGAYRHRDSVDRTVARVATRLSRNGEKLVDCLEDLRRNEAAAEAGFEAFFPDLVAHVATLRAG